jgi:hypothetical protein
LIIGFPLFQFLLNLSRVILWINGWLAADMMDVFSELPRDLNFLDHTSDIGWKAYA